MPVGLFFTHKNLVEYSMEHVPKNDHRHPSGQAHYYLEVQLTRIRNLEGLYMTSY